MKAKTARRRLIRLMWKIAEAKVNGTKTRFIKKAFRREINSLKRDQRNSASTRVYQRLMWILR
jgi:hypothetical protein